MSVTSIFATVFRSIPHLSILLLNLLWMYLTLGRRVNKTRRAFEKQLMQQGMSKQDAQRLSACYEDLKNNITGMLKQGITSMRFQAKWKEEDVKQKTSKFFTLFFMWFIGGGNCPSWIGRCFCITLHGNDTACGFLFLDPQDSFLPCVLSLESAF